MKFLNELDKATNMVVEAKVTDYIDADSLGEIIIHNPILNKYKDCEPIDNMLLKMTSDTGYEYYKVIKNDDGDFEAYWVSRDGKKLGDTFLLEGDFNDEARYEIYITTRNGDGSYSSSLYDTVYNFEQAEDICAELGAQGLNASYDTVFPNEDPDYDKYADETNWAAEEEADAIERMERRYGGWEE